MSSVVSPDDIPNIGLFFHLFFVFGFIGGIGIATTLRFAAAYGGYRKASDVALLLSLVRPLVAVVVLSLLCTISFGFWTASSMQYPMTDNWLIVTYSLVGFMLIVGAIAGKHDKNTRIMAVKEASTLNGHAISGVENGHDKHNTADNEVEISPELESRLKSPIPIGLNLSMVAAVLVVLGMMVFRPGNTSANR